MAKPRSGLGRGLGSLLGAMDGTIAETTSANEQEAAKEPEGKTDQAEEDAPAVPSDKKDEKEESSPSKPEVVEEQEPIVIAEDNFTIKGVVSREVAAPAKPRVAERPDDEVDINLIVPNPYQPRTSFAKEELEELAESIKKNGLLSPILVREYEGKYQIIAGERRYQACKKLGLSKVPVRLKEADDDEAIILALVENIQRSNLNPIEEAYGYRRMMERGKMTQSEVAQAVSKGRTTITNALRLLELPEEAQKLLYEEKITAGHARAILSVPTPEGRDKLTRKIVDDKLSVRDAERIARLMSGKKKDQEARPPAPKSFKTVARALSDTLEADVKIRRSKSGNQIQISFDDEADLQRLFKLISNE